MAPLMTGAQIMMVFNRDGAPPTRRLSCIVSDGASPNSAFWYFLTSLRLGACFGLFGREVVGSGIWGLQQTQRDALATMVVLVF